MSGLLQRLAWRALGRPCPIRPIVGRSAAVARHDTPPPGEQHAAAPALQSAPASEAPQILHARTEASGTAGDGGTQTDAAAHRVSAAVLPPERSTRAPNEVLLAEQRLTQAALVQPMHASQSAPWNDDETVQATEIAAAPAAASLRVQAARTGRRSAQGVDIDGDTAAQRVSRHATAQPSAGDAARGLRGTQPLVAPVRARDEVTEVHVTIGRIELTAAAPAARPRQEPARPRKPQSLDEYLARREASRR
jgi:hypothetical protein